MALPRIVWTAPELKRERNFARLAPHALRRLTTSPSPDAFRLSAAIEQFGVPHVQTATTSKEDHAGLLMLAAEVEHALMVQYLYAAKSVIVAILARIGEPSSQLNTLNGSSKCPLWARIAQGMPRGP